MTVAYKDKQEVSGSAIESPPHAIKSPPSCAPLLRYRLVLRSVASGSQIAALTENNQVLTVTLSGLTMIFRQQGTLS